MILQIEQEAISMRECPKCGELNGDNNSSCYKCGAYIGKVENYKKICRTCGTVYSGSKTYCDSCGGDLSVYDPYIPYDAKSRNSGSNTWMYVCTFLIPLLGIIFGCTKLNKDEDLAKNLIALGIVLIVVYGMLSMLLAKCGA